MTVFITGAAGRLTGEPRPIPTVLVTGAAGFLGINLVRYLLKYDYTIIGYDLAAFDYPELADITFIQGDIRDAATLESAMQGSSIVVHCAAALPLYSKQDIFSTDITGTTNVLAAAQHLGVERVIHISSTAVYGIPDHHPLREDDTLIGVGPYGEAKIQAEQICVDYRDQGMCVPILRPKSFVGPERLGVFALLYDWAKSGKNFPMIGNGRNRYQLLDVEDLCMTKDRSVVNDTFNIGAKEFTTMAEDYQVVLDKAGFNKRIIGFPAAPMIWTLRLLELLHISPLYKWVYETASKDSFVDISKAERQLGFQPQFSNKAALLRNYDWYLQNVDSFEETSGISHRVPWKQGILKLAKIFF